MNLGTIKFSAACRRLSRYRADYWQILIPLWNALKANEIEVFTSELTLLETLVQPIKQNNNALVAAYETLLTKTEIRLQPINADILREAANLRQTKISKLPMPFTRRWLQTALTF